MSKSRMLTTIDELETLLRSMKSQPTQLNPDHLRRRVDEALAKLSDIEDDARRLD